MLRVRSSATFALLLGVPLFIAAAMFYTPLTQWVAYNSEHSRARTAPNASSARVWVSKQSGFYYCAGTKPYGNVKPGSYMAQTDAIQSGYRPISEQACR
jgi:hypothetical protein